MKYIKIILIVYVFDVFLCTSIRTISDNRTNLYLRIKNYERFCLHEISEEFITTAKSGAFLDETNNVTNVNNVEVWENLEKLTDIEYRRIDYYIIQTKTENLKNILLKLEKKKYFTAKAKFVFVLNRISRLTFEILSTFFIINAIVIVNSDSVQQDIYTYYPYVYENLYNPSLKFRKINSCKNNKLEKKNMNLFPDKLPKLWRNTTLTMCIIPIFPFTVIDKDENLHGFEATFFKNIQQALQFKMNYTTKYINLGLYPNGTDKEALSAIRRKTISSGIGVFYLKYEFVSDFDISSAVWHDDFKWFIPKALRLPKWKNVYLICLKQTWTIIYCTILIFFMINFTIFLMSEFYKNKLEIFLDSFFNVVCILIGVNINKYPNLLSMKIYLLVFIYFSLILTAIINGKLISYLTEVTYQKQEETLIDIIQSKLKIGISSISSQLFRNSSDFNEQFLFNNCVPCDASNFCTDEAAFKRNMAVARIKTYMKFRLFERYLDSEGRSLLHMGANINSCSYHWLYYKGFPMFEQIDNSLLRLKAGGITNFNYDLLEHQYRVKSRVAVKKKNKRHKEELDLEHFGIAFYIFITGIVLSCVIFYLEYNKYIK